MCQAVAVQHVNRRTIREGTPRVVNVRRWMLRRRARDTERKLAMDVHERGTLPFIYAPPSDDWES